MHMIFGRLIVCFGLIGVFCYSIENSADAAVISEGNGYHNPTTIEKIQFIQSLTREEAITLLLTVQSTCQHDSCNVAILSAMKQKQGTKQ